VAQIVWRTYSQAGLEEMAEHSTVPVINSLSDDYHPCQSLADLMTVQEHKGSLAGLKFAYIGDAANNMANSYLIGCALAGMHVRVAAPAGYEPDHNIVLRAAAIAATTGGSVEVFGEPESAILGADVVATDTDLMAKADSAAIFLHCLPAYRGYEVSADVIDGPQSVIWDEAENRLHAQKALMVWLDEQANG
jgi:ornithine carbamoyltransferase